MVEGSARLAQGRARVTTHLVDGASGHVLWSSADDVAARRRAGRPAAHRRRRRRAARSPSCSTPAPAGGPRDLGQPRRPQPLPAGPVPPEPAHRGRPAARRWSSSSARSSRTRSTPSPTAGWPTRTACSAHYGVLGPADVWAKAASSAASAVMLDALSAEAHTSLAHVHATQDWDWPGAEREFLHSIRLNPRYPTAHHWYAMSCLVPMGRLDAALEQMQTAQALDPVSSIISRDLAVIHFYRRDFDRALDQCDHTVELNPHFAAAYLTLGPGPGAAPRLRRVGGGLPPRRRPGAALAADARGAGPDLRAVGSAGSGRTRRSTRCARWPPPATSRPSTSSPSTWPWASSTRGCAGWPGPATTAASSCWRSASTRGSTPCATTAEFAATTSRVRLGAPHG